jgi:Undecaprenyl-phosphate galactose phosphotransferase WbaP
MESGRIAYEDENMKEDVLPAGDRECHQFASDPAPVIPGAESMSNLWNDRRQTAQPLISSERRSGTDRRSRVSAVAGSRRGTRLSRIAKSGKLHSLILIGGDMLALSLSFILAFALSVALDPEIGWRRLAWQSQSWSVLVDYARILQFAVAGSAAITIFWVRGFYSRRRPFWDEIYATTKLILLFACVEATFIFAVGRSLPRVWVLGTWLLAVGMIPLARNLIKRTLDNFKLWSRPTVIIGIGRNAQDVATALSAEVGLGLYVSVFLVPPPSWIRDITDDDNEIPSSLSINGRHVPVRSIGTDPERVLKALGAPHVVVALESDNLWEVSKLLHSKNLPYSSLSIAPSIRGLPLIGMEVLNFFKHDVMMLRIRNNLARKLPRLTKRAFDLAGALLLLVMLSPLLVLLYMAIRQSGPGVFFGHVRLGRNGRRFKCYKFRTMVPDAQKVLSQLLESDPVARAEWAKDFKLKRDPRITNVGRFLRKSSLDELPQLWNVVRGEMSLVGPRPIIEEELERYENKKDFFLEAKPGITGLWQISGRNDVTYAERVQLDAWYARNWQLWYDVVILLKTVKVVFGKKGAY